MRLLGFFAVMVLLLLVTRVAFAGDATALAREHFNKGTSLYDLARYREAAAEYELAYQAKNDPALLYNIAQVWRLAGESAKAITFYKSYLRRFPDASNRAQVENWIQELQMAAERVEHVQQGEPVAPIPALPGGPPQPVTSTPVVIAPQTTAISSSAAKGRKHLWVLGLVAGVVVVAVGVGVGVAIGTQPQSPTPMDGILRF